MKVAAVLFAGALALVTQGCAPCSTVGGCETGTPHMTVDGQIVDPQTGRGVDGVRIDMQLIGGKGVLDIPGATTVTADGGFWRISVPASVPESVLVQFKIASPISASPYSEFRWIVPSQLKGDAYVMDRLVAKPYYPYFVTLHHRGRPSEVFASTEMEFHQTGGPPIYGADASGNIHASSDASGLAQFFFYHAFATDTGYVEGQLTAHLPPQYGDSKATVDLYPTVQYLRPALQLSVAVGPSLAYAVVVQNRSDGRPAAGVRIDFARTGGAEIDPASFSLTTDANGRAVFPSIPLASGTVTGRVTLTPRVGAPEALDVSVPTFDNDSTPLFATWRVGSTTSSNVRIGASVGR